MTRRQIIPAHPSELTECWMDGCGLRYTPPLRTKLYRWWMAKRGFERVVDTQSVADWPEIWRTYRGSGYMWVRRNA